MRSLNHIRIVSADEFHSGSGMDDLSVVFGIGGWHWATRCLWWTMRARLFAQWIVAGLRSQSKPEPAICCRVERSGRAEATTRRELPKWKVNIISYNRHATIDTKTREFQQSARLRSVPHPPPNLESRPLTYLFQATSHTGDQIHRPGFLTCRESSCLPFQ